MSKKKKHQKQLNIEPQPEEVQRKPLKMPETTMTFDAMFSSALEQMLDEAEPEAKKQEPEVYPVVILPENRKDISPRADDPRPTPVEETELDDQVEQALMEFVSDEKDGNENSRPSQDDLPKTEPMPEPPQKKSPKFRRPKPDYDLPSFMEQAAPLHETEAFDAPEVFTVPVITETAHDGITAPETPEVFTVPETPESDAMEAPEHFEVSEQPESEMPELQKSEQPAKGKDRTGWFRHHKKMQKAEIPVQTLPEQEAAADVPPAPEEDTAQTPQIEDTQNLLLRVDSLLGDTDNEAELPVKQAPEERTASDPSPTIRFSVPEERTERYSVPEQTVRLPSAEERLFAPVLRRQETPQDSRPEISQTQPADFWQEFAELKDLVMSSDDPQTALSEEPEVPQPPAQTGEEPEQKEPVEKEVKRTLHTETRGVFRNRREKHSRVQKNTIAETEAPVQSKAPDETPKKKKTPAKDAAQPDTTAKPRHFQVSGAAMSAAAMSAAVAASLPKPQHRTEEPTVIQSADTKNAPAEPSSDAQPKTVPKQTAEVPDDLHFLHRRGEKPSDDGTAAKPAHPLRTKTAARDVLRPDEAIRSYHQKLGSTGTRLVLAVFVTLLSLFFTVYASLGWTFLPQEGNISFTAYILLALLLITAALAYDIFKDAARDLKKMRFSAGALVAFALLVIVADTVQAAATDRVPFCTVAAIPVLFLLWDRYDGVTGILTTLRTVCDAKDPKGIVEVPDVMKGRVGLSRAEGSVDEFMDKYETVPPTVKLMQIYAPVTVVVCILAAALIASKSGTPFFWVLSLLLLGSIPLIGILNFSRLFCILAKRLRTVNAALCGWYGAQTFGDEHAILVGDADLFPKSNIKFNGIKMISPNADRVIAYAAAAMKAVDSVLYPLFEEELRSRNGRHYRVDRYRFYESGGIGAQIAGDIVLLGTLDFMKHMGVHMEGGMKLKQAVYTSVNGELAAVFAIKFTPKEAVRRGLTAIAGNRRFRTVFVTRDFLLTPEMIREKYEISLNNTAYPPIKERIRLSETELKEKGKQGALMADESFGSFADAAAGGRVLKSAVKICMLLTVFNGIIGALLMSLLAYQNGFEAATALNLLLYELIWAIPTLLLTGWTRRY